jgi:predicted transcriptional regulator
MKNIVKAVKVGILPLEQFKKRTIAIAKGEYKPKKDEPKIWFNSIKSLAHVLSEENQQLLRLIADTNPQSIKELELLTGRKANNLLRTLRTMESYGLVELQEGQRGRGRAALIPKVLYEAAHIEIEFGHAA